MAPLKRRKKVEGWAVDIPDNDVMYQTTFRQRLAENNKLYILCIAAVLGIVFLLYAHANKMSGMPKEDAVTYENKGIGYYTDAAHKKFAQTLKSDDSYNSVIISAGFTGPSAFRIVAHADISADEIDYISRTAANAILAKFKNRVVVEFYTKSTGSDKQKLRAVTKWEPKKYGFAVKYAEI